jgi:DNA-binding beta-propeller fold protein YncE
LAIDGLNLWVANIDDGTVTKLRAGDGKVLGTFAVGGGPGPLAFDGVNMWVVNNGPGTVTKLRASDGANLGTFNTGGSLPAAIAFDGQHIWIGNSGTSPVNASLIKLRLSDGAIVSKFPISEGAFSAAFDGANVWITGGDPIFKF